MQEKKISGVKERSVMNSFRHFLGRDFYPWAFCLMLIIPSLNYYINDIAQLYMGRGSVSILFYGVLSLLSVLVYMRSIGDKKGMQLLLLWTLIIAGVLFSYIRYPSIKEFIWGGELDPLKNWMIYAPLFLIPMSFVASKCSDWKLILRILYPLSVITILTGLLSYYLVVIVAGHFFEVNYMSFSYNMLLPFCCAVTYGVINRNLIALIIGIAAFLAVFLFGSRGATVWALVYVAIFLYERFKSKKHLIWGGVLASVAIVFIVSHFASFSESALNVMDENNTSSRVLTKIADGEFDQSEGRDNINKIIKTAIWERPIFGGGLFADRHYLKQGGLTGYAHNILYEMMCDFGIFFGPFILLFLLVRVYKLYRMPNEDFHRILLILLPNGFFELFISGSFLTNLCFWCLVGMMFNNYIKNSYAKKDYVVQHI